MRTLASRGRIFVRSFTRIVTVADLARPMPKADAFVEAFDRIYVRRDEDLSVLVGSIVSSDRFAVRLWGTANPDLTLVIYRTPIDLDGQPAGARQRVGELSLRRQYPTPVVEGFGVTGLARWEARIERRADVSNTYLELGVTLLGEDDTSRPARPYLSATYANDPAPARFPLDDVSSSEIAHYLAHAVDASAATPFWNIVAAENRARTDAYNGGRGAAAETVTFAYLDELARPIEVAA